MGKDAQVKASLPGGPGNPYVEDGGRLQYEPPKLLFRGAERRVFEGAALAGVRAEAGDLVLADGSRFTLGEKQAASWADAILNPKGRMEKLGVKAGQHVAIVNLDDPVFAVDLAGIVSNYIGETEKNLDLLFYGADSDADLAGIPALIPRLGPKGAVWIVSLKGKLLRLKDTEVMAAAKAAGLVDSKVVSFSETRTALRFTRRK